MSIGYYSVSAVDIFSSTRMDVKGKKYSCDRCGLKVGYRQSLLRHIKNIHEGDVNEEKKCQAMYTNVKSWRGVHTEQIILEITEGIFKLDTV